MRRISTNKVSNCYSEKIDSIGGLSDSRRQYLQTRWLDQVIWTDSKARKSRNMHYVTQLIAAVGSITLIALANIVFDYGANQTLMDFAQALFNILGFIVAISLAASATFRFDKKWEHYRKTTELLLSEGWRFLELYAEEQATNADATNLSGMYRSFVERIESIVSGDIERYFTLVIPDKHEQYLSQ